MIAAPPQAVPELARLAAEVAPDAPGACRAGGRQPLRVGLARAGRAPEEVAVRRGARCRTAARDAELLDRCVSQLERWGCDGVVAAARAVDTIKEADAGGRVLATLRARAGCGRSRRRRSFRARALAAALADGDLERAYDDAQLVEAAGGDVRIVEAPRQNLKVTTAHDLRVAALLLS